MEGFITAALRAMQVIWTLLVTAMIGNVIASNINGDMKAINFTMFVAALSWVVALYGLVATVFSTIMIPIILMALDVLAVLFTLICGIVLAAELKAVNCGGSYAGKGSGWIAFGSADTEKRCRELQASTAFMWFLWVSFAAGLFFTVRAWRTGGSLRSKTPGMSQVGV